MFDHYKYILLCLILFLLSRTQAHSCSMNTTQLQPRIFENLLDLQSNKIPFKLSDDDSKGNDVTFKDDNMGIIQKNAFVTYDSVNIRKVNLNSKQIPEIEDGAFYQLDCLVILDLSNNNISTITKGIFEGMQFLRELDISRNALQSIPEEVFTYVPHLYRLSIAHNQIQTLKRGSFYKLWLLNHLDLSYNLLKSVPGEFTKHFKSLTNLQLGSNEIDDLGVEYWRDTTRLRILNVTDNALARFDMMYKYSFRQTLTQLYLAQNNLTILTVTHIQRRLPALRLLDINDNSFSCAELLQIVQKLNKSSVAHPGNAVEYPKIADIACDRKVDKKEEPVVTETTTKEIGTTTEKIRTTTLPPEPVSHISIMIAVPMGLLILAVIYAVVNILFKRQCCRWMRRGNYTEVEVMPMMRGRYR